MNYMLYLGATCQQTSIVNRRSDAQHAQSANINHLLFLRKVQAVDLLNGLVEVPSIVDKNVDLSSFHAQNHRAAAVVIAHINVADHTRSTFKLERISAGNVYNRSLSNELFGDREAQTSVTPCIKRKSGHGERKSIIIRCATYQSPGRPFLSRKRVHRPHQCRAFVLDC